MAWDIKDASGRTIAKVDQPFTFIHPPDVYFTGPNGTNGAEIIGVLRQHWCGFCLNDDWTILIRRPDVVHPSVFGYQITHLR
eukprot:gene9956-biopygen4896